MPQLLKKKVAIGLTLSVSFISCAHRSVDLENLNDHPVVSVESKKAAKFPKKIAGNEATAEYHFAMAQAYATQGDSDKAIEEYQATLMYDSKSALVHSRLAGEYVKKGNFTSAMDFCKSALKQDPDFIDARLMLAGLYSATRDANAALHEYDVILKKNPHHEETNIYKSQVLLEAGKNAEAIQTLKALIKTAPESTLAWYYLGRAEQRARHPSAANFERSAAAFKKALELRPSFSQAALALGLLYETQKKNNEAIEVYKNSYDESQDLPIANRLTTLLLKVEKYKEAIPYLEATVAADPEDLNVRVKLGLVEMEMKNFDRAIELFNGILKKNPESDRVRFYLGSIYEQLNQSESAISQFKQVQPDSKLYSDAVLHTAYIYRQTGKPADARAWVEKGIEKSPRNVGFYLFVASLDEETRDYAKAAKILEQAVALFPEDEKSLYYLGSMYDRLGRVDDALKKMEALLGVNAKNPDALNYLGYTWTMQGIRLDDAEKMLRQAVALRPNNAYIQDSWGWHLFIRGRVKEAVVELEKAVRLRPGEPTILEHLADAYLRTNLRQKALFQYQLAIQHSDDEAVRRKIDSKIELLRVELAGEKERTQHGERRYPAGE